MTAAKKPEGLELLRAPFTDNQISTLPKPYKKDSPRGNCNVCKGFHGLPAVHLDYVGHAAITDRLLDADPSWGWEPLAFGPDGLPALDRNGGLWIKLTVCGVTRIGYGDADGKTGGNAMKEAIGDALRNASMRFGAALDLWHKGDLHAAEQARNDPPATPAEVVTKERKVQRGKLPEDPWANVEIAKPPVVTDALWFAKWRERTALAGTIGELRGLHGEMVEQHKTRNLTDDDRRDAETLIGEMREQVQSEAALITETEPAA